MRSLVGRGRNKIVWGRRLLLVEEVRGTRWKVQGRRWKVDVEGGRCNVEGGRWEVGCAMQHVGKRSEAYRR